MDEKKRYSFKETILKTDFVENFRVHYCDKQGCCVKKKLKHNKDGETDLMKSSFWGLYAVIRLLLEAGAKE